MFARASLIAASSFFLLILLAGCPSLDLGTAPFICNNGIPRCPLGYTCKKSGTDEFCVKDGYPLPQFDGLKDLAASDADIGVADLARDLTMSDAEGGTIPVDKGVVTAKIILSEFMADPGAVSDDTGEWIELFNPGSINLNINGWTIKDTQSDLHKIKNGGPLFVPANSYLVIGRTTNTSQNGGTPVAYAYDNFALGNANDEIVLLNEKLQVVDSFSYNTNTGYSIIAGASLSLKAPTLDKTVGANWCAEMSLWTGSMGDKGTPLNNPKCN